MLDAFLGLLTPAQWEAWRNWLTTCGGLIALLIAARTYAQNSRYKREEQARLVYSRVVSLQDFVEGSTFELVPDGDLVCGFHAHADFERDENGRITERGIARGGVVQAVVTLENRSKEVIGPVRVRLAFSRDPWPDSSGDTVGTIARESSTSVVLVGDNASSLGVPTLQGAILFRDSGGNWWHRVGTGPVEHTHDDPTNPSASVLDDHRGAVWLGTGYDSEAPGDPRIPLRTRLHRLRRRLAGKPPIP